EVKKGVLQSGQPADYKASYVLPEGRRLFALRVHPVFGPGKAVIGITTTATDISGIRSLESDEPDLNQELAGTLQRYETALRGSNVTVYTQDRDLRYTSISNPMFERKVDEIIGFTDNEVLPAASRAAIIALKQIALETGTAQDSEVCIQTAAGER